MKTKNLFSVLLITLFLSGCVVYSFYPLYTQSDLFPNDLLTGEWYDSDSTLWKFEHPYKGKRMDGNMDKTRYILKMKPKGEDDFTKHDFEVTIVDLEGHYFADFYLDDYESDDIGLFDFHIIPVHTFAKLTFEEDNLFINWFNQDWLEDLIKQNKVRIHHENNGDIILLTAKAEELQKFVIKYADTNEAFEEGLEAELKR